MSENQETKQLTFDELLAKSNLNSVLYSNLNDLNEEAKIEIDFLNQNTTLIFFIIDRKPTFTYDFEAGIWKGAAKVNAESDEYIVVEDKEFPNVVFGLIDGLGQREIKN